MDNMDDDYLTNLSWLKVSNSSELQSTVECSNNYIDDDLQCLCWLIKMRSASYSSHSLKRLSCTRHKDNYSHNLSRSLSSMYVFDRPLNTVTNPTIDTRNTDDNPTSRRILNKHLSPTESSQQSVILIRSSNGKISCLSIRQFV